MAMYLSKSNVYQNGSITKPDQFIDPRDKNKKEWLIANSKYIYYTYLQGRCAYTPNDVNIITELRNYADGCQNTDKYKNWIYGEKPEGEAERKAWDNIDFENLYSPMPKIMDKLAGMFLSQDHNCIATATSEKAKLDKKDKWIAKYAAMKTKPLRDAINMLSGGGMEVPTQEVMAFIENDIQEIQMIADTGGYKLPYEVAAEMLIDATIKSSDYKFLKKKILRDIVTFNGAAVMESYNSYLNKIKWEYVDCEDLIIEYSNSTHHNDSSYCGRLEWWTIEELAKRGFATEQELKEIAAKFQSIQRNALLKFNNYDVYYNHTNSYGYYDWRIPVLYTAWKSTDCQYKNRVKVKDGSERLLAGDFGKIKENTIVVETENVYENRWIIDTEYCFDAGKMYYQTRNSAGNVSLPIHCIRLDGKSIVERSMPILDQLALWFYKMQNACANATPAGYKYDYTALENISEPSGGKLKPFDLIKMHRQTGDIVGRTVPVDNEINYSAGFSIVDRLEGGIGEMLNEFILHKRDLFSDLAEITGISPFEVPTSQAGTATEARLAVASMSDVLKPIYDCFIELKEKLSYNTIYRTQLILKYDKSGRDALSGQIGSYYTDILAEAYDTEPTNMGIKFEAMATEAQQQMIAGVASRALSAGRSGKPILRMSEYMYIMRNINSVSGLKRAEMLIAKREKEDEMLAIQMQQAQLQAMQQQQELANQGKAQGIGMKASLDMEKQKQGKDLDLRNAMAIKKGEVEVDMMNQGLADGREEAMQQQQNPLMGNR